MIDLSRFRVDLFYKSTDGMIPLSQSVKVSELGQIEELIKGVELSDDTSQNVLLIEKEIRKTKFKPQQ